MTTTTSSSMQTRSFEIAYNPFFQTIQPVDPYITKINNYHGANCQSESCRRLPNIRLAKLCPCNHYICDMCFTDQIQRQEGSFDQFRLFRCPCITKEEGLCSKVIVGYGINQEIGMRLCSTEIVDQLLNAEQMLVLCNLKAQVYERDCIALFGQIVNQQDTEDSLEPTEENYTYLDARDFVLSDVSNTYVREYAHQVDRANATLENALEAVQSTVDTFKGLVSHERKPRLIVKEKRKHEEIAKKNISTEAHDEKTDDEDEQHTPNANKKVKIDEEEEQTSQVVEQQVDDSSNTQKSGKKAGRKPGRKPGKTKEERESAKLK